MEAKEIKHENRLTIMEQKIDNLTNAVNNIATDIKEHVKWEAEKYEKLDSKYSGKWVEGAIIAIGTAIIIALFGAIITYFIK